MHDYEDYPPLLEGASGVVPARGAGAAGRRQGLRPEGHPDGRRIKAAGVVLVRQRPGGTPAWCSSPWRTRPASPTWWSEPRTVRGVSAAGGHGRRG
ncbi:MAG: hypothetical protein WDM92_12275 [Caulobacteraceae bacterium]